ncbi:N/A [soil metagenome]
MNLRAILMAAAGLLALSSGTASAQSTPASPPSPVASDPVNTVSDIVVTARRLDAARLSIQSALGATTYSVSDASIQALPGGDNQELNQVVLQLPGAVQDGFGQLHIRGDHNNLQFRLNGVILPEGLSVFGQTLSPRLIERLDLITGALPAQYGLRTAGIIDLTTKSGVFKNGGQVSVYGGAHGTYEPAFEYGGSANGGNFFVSGDFRRTQLGIESVDGSSTPNHDRADQATFFTYLDKILSQNDRIAFTGGYSNQRFQIPNPRGLDAATDGPGYVLRGQTAYPSESLDETQRETTGFFQASFLHDSGPLTVQASIFGRYSSLTFTPDATGDLLFNGQAQAASKKDTSFGLQTEGAYRINDAHTVRGGVIIQAERGTSRTATQVFPVDGTGAQTSDVPITINDRSASNNYLYSLYLQDEWLITPQLTLNYGLRADQSDGFRSEGQISPRINAVWRPLEGTTLHAGYARYFSPPPFELVGAPTVALFQGTSAASPGTQDTTPFAERSNYYDVGAQQRIDAVPGLTLGVDAYYRQTHNLIDEGQFGAPIILTPFNYQDGRIYGVELSANYNHGPWLAYANFAYSKAQGRNIVSSQFSFDPADLAYIQNHYIYLDHDQTYTGSAGVSYSFKEGLFAGTQLGADLIYGSGLRADGAVPNGNSLNDYTQVNLTAAHTFDLPYAGPLKVRVDVVNVGDAQYFIRDGSGIGVGAPQYGPRRGVFAGITKTF